jgi:hypothetical protein
LDERDIIDWKVKERVEMEEKDSKISITSYNKKKGKQNGLQKR